MTGASSPIAASPRAAHREFDVAIVGGGLVGASLALGLAGTAVRTLLIESVAPDSAAQPSFDERTTALGNASRRILQGLGAWDDISRDAAAIRAIHVSDAGRFGFARLKAADHGIDAFGYVVPNRVIGTALWRRLTAVSGVEIRVPASVEDLEITTERAYFKVVTASGAREVTSARLLVAADGAHSIVRAAAGIEAGVEDYDQVAIAAAVVGDRAHDGTAYERFTPTGPVAVLPLRGGGYGTIWSCAPQRAAEMLTLEDDAYLAALQSRFGWRAGRFRRIGRRASYPLKLSRATTTVARRTVLIGNAAQALHPIAGQGFNLGLRDAAMLAEMIADATGDIGSADLLRKFATDRAADRGGVVRFTDGLVKLFGSRMPGVSLVRNLGLLAFDLSPPAKRALARVSLGFGGPTPRLARGLPLQ
ncbi:MAG TPA: 2-octaprenyl-6-methoxyphenyl hydroxylase [Steroidobacteraceae bacterium]|jgi:2-octaprenyl-6-methoxyphenol hydroxylase|nr:2-octaprenyl-6-methoxyphenyl hydroxylase [Steroidobacteraceae bacterium]